MANWNNENERREYFRQWYAKNKERVCAQQRAAYAARLEERRAKQRKHYAETAEKQRESSKRKYAKNREKIRARQAAKYRENIDVARANARRRTAEYTARNPEAVREYQQRWSKANRQKRREAERRWAKRHRDVYLAKKRRYYERKRKANPEAMREHSRSVVQTWRKANPLKSILLKQRRRAALAGVPHTLTAAEWRQTLEVFGHKCAYCLRQLGRTTQDHVIAITRGGDHTMDNVVPACKSCNSKKHNSPVFMMVGRSL